MKSENGKVDVQDLARGEIKLILEALKDKKGEDIRIYDLRGRSSITEYVILVTAVSEPHAKALNENLNSVTKDKRISIIGHEDTSDSGWFILDAFDFMVHIQTESMRTLYALEDLWKDCLEVNFS